MLKEFISNHVFMSSILAVGVISLFLQGLMVMFLKSYVRASANMKTTKKKILIQLQNQYEAMYGMDCEIRNTLVYVDKFLMKLRFLGVSYSGWERVPFLSAGIAVLAAVAGIFYGYINGAGIRTYAEILFACGVVLACLFIFFHIYGIKSKKHQIQIQLVDYLENYVKNRLARNREGREGMTQGKMADNKNRREKRKEGVDTDKMEMSYEAVDTENGDTTNGMEQDMEMLTRLLSKMEKKSGESQTEKLTSRTAASKEGDEDAFSEVTYDSLNREPEESELKLLEEFVQSFLA